MTQNEYQIGEAAEKMYAKIRAEQLGPRMKTSWLLWVLLFITFCCVSPIVFVAGGIVTVVESWRAWWRIYSE